MKVDDADARTSILFLLSSLPPVPKQWWMTPKEFTDRLCHGGADSRLDDSLVAKALQVGVKQNHPCLYSRPREIIPGLDGRRHRTYRWDSSNQRDTPLSQRLPIRGRGSATKIKSPPSIRHEYYLARSTDNKYHNHLSAITAYYDAVNPSTDSSTPPAPASPAPTTNPAAVTPDSAARDSTGESASDDGGANESVENEDEDGPSAHRGYEIHDADSLDEYFETLFRHKSTCRFGTRNTTLVLIKHKKEGYCSVRTHQCSGCREVFSYRSSRDVKSSSKVPGTKFTRSQPEINLLMSSAAANCAVWPTNLYDMMAEVGLQCPTLRNMKRADKKVRSAISEVADECMAANRRLENSLAEERVEFTDADGKTRSAAVIEASHDGMGPKRFIANRCTGVAHCSLTGLPLCAPCDLISCVRCNKKFTEEWEKAKKEGKELIPSNINLRHNGPCYRNSKHSPATAEEHSLERAGIDLLNRSDGSARPDDEALFIGNHVTDGDSKGAKRSAAAQAKIVGDAAVGKADGCGDWGHLKKNQKKEMHEYRTKGNLGGVAMLTSMRITSISSDVEGAVRRYKSGAIDVATTPAVKKRKLDDLMVELKAVVPHHCGIHSGCTANMCKMVALDNENPDWSDEKLHEEYAKVARYKGRFMNLSKEGQDLLTKTITKRITRANADRVALMKSTNPNESMFGSHAKYTHGKRKHTHGTDVYENILLRVVAQKTLDRNFSPTVNAKLGIVENDRQKSSLDRIHKQKEADKARKNTEKYKERRSAGKLFRGLRTEKETKADRSRAYKPEKTNASGKVGPKKTPSAAKRPKAIPTCKNPWCKQLGHTKSQCLNPRPGFTEKLSKKEQKMKDEAKAEVQAWLDII